MNRTESPNESMEKNFVRFSHPKPYMEIKNIQNIK